MAKSMTGFGKSLLSENDLNVSVEIKSVNNRNRDIRMRIPYTLNALEITLRKQIEQVVQRGYVEVNINYEDLRKEPDIKLDINGAKAYLQIYREIENLTGETLNSKALLLAKNPNIISKQEEILDEQRYLPVLTKAIGAALSEYDHTRIIEGDNLVRDLQKRIQNMRILLEKIEQYAATVPVCYKEKLLNRLQNLLDENLEEYYDGQRVAAEIAIFTDKADVTEEVTRLHSHFEQFTDLLKKDTAIGKNLDFIVQEFLRETNTIGSKANALEITQLVVEMKTNIEKVREQVQNIE